MRGALHTCEESGVVHVGCYMYNILALQRLNALRREHIGVSPGPQLPQVASPPGIDMAAAAPYGRDAGS